MRLILLLVGLAIIAVAVYFSIQLWEAHPIIASLIDIVGAYVGVRVMMAG